MQIYCLGPPCRGCTHPGLCWAELNWHILIDTHLCSISLNDQYFRVCVWIFSTCNVECMVRPWTTSGASNMWGRNHFPLILQYFMQTAMVRVWFVAEHLYRKRSSCLFCSHSFHVQESFEHLYWIKCHPCKLFALRHLYATFPMVEHRSFSQYICTSAFKGMTIIWYACPPGDHVWTKML